MTITTTTRHAGPYVCNGITTAFPFSFKVFDDADLFVTVTSGEGVTVEQTLGAHYFVALNANQNDAPGGVVQMILAPAISSTLSITSAVLPLQETSITNGGAFYADVIEDALDRLTILAQQLIGRLTDSVDADPAAWSSALLASDGAARVGFKLLEVGAVARTVAQKLSDRISAVDFGLSASLPDNTAALQAAIDAIEDRVGGGNNNGGIIEIPPGIYTFLGTININSSFVRLIGAGTQSTYLHFANGANDCIVINGASAPGGSIRDVSISDLSINGNGAKTSGAAIVVRNAFRCLVERVAAEECITGIDASIVNDLILRDVMIVPNQPGSLYGIWWHAPSDGSGRNDVLVLNNVTIECQWSNATGFQWEGASHTVVGSGLRVLHCEYGIRVANPGNSAVYYPSFCNLQDIELEGFKKRALDILSGNDFKLTDFDISNLTGVSGQGNSDDIAISIAADIGASYVRGIQLSNGRVGLCRQSAIVCDAMDVQFSNIICATTSYSTPNGFPVVSLGPNSKNVQIANLRAEEFGSAVRSNYAVQIASGADRVCGINVDASYCNSGAVLNNSTGRVAFYNTISHTGALIPYIGSLLPNFANDAAASAGGIAVGGWYRNGSVQMQRVA